MIEAAKVFAFTGLAVIGGTYCLARYNDPFRTKPIPPFDDFMKELTSKADKQTKERYLIETESCVDGDCSFGCLPDEEKEYTGNIYSVIIELDKYLEERTREDSSCDPADVIRFFYYETADGWNPKKNSFMEEFTNQFRNGASCRSIEIVQLSQ